MNVLVYNHYSKTTQQITGDEARVAFELMRLYPWLRTEDPANHGVSDLIEELNCSQAYDAQVLDPQLNSPGDLQKTESKLQEEGKYHVLESMCGHQFNFARNLAAARFLTGGRQAPLDGVRQALLEADDDTVAAALKAHGLQNEPNTRKALQDIKTLSSLEKSLAPRPVAVDGPLPSASGAVRDIKTALQDNFVLPVALGGKHSVGSFLVRNEAAKDTWLLKPGSKGPGPAAGDHDSGVSESRREAAFYAVALSWGLEQFIPETQLVLLDGKEYAAIRLLPWSYKTLETLKEHDPSLPVKLLRPYLEAGLLHRWAVLDAVLGNPDRHAGNIMCSSQDVKLIDHGSAFAGKNFDPAHDKFSFVPYYLRAFSPSNYAALDPADRLNALPQIAEDQDVTLKQWMLQLDVAALEKILVEYGIDPQPAIMRLSQLLVGATSGHADVAINKFWVNV